MRQRIKIQLGNRAYRIQHIIPKLCVGKRLATCCAPLTFTIYLFIIFLSNFIMQTIFIHQITHIIFRTIFSNIITSLLAHIYF